MTENVKTGVIGVGYLGRFHAQKYAKMAGVELVGVADADPQRAAQVADECGTRPFADYRELLPLVDAVSVVVPTVLHHEVARACRNPISPPAAVRVMMPANPGTATAATSRRPAARR